MPVTLITGASTGIGLATALHFGRHGQDVWAGVRNPSAATQLREAIETERLPVRLVALDVDDDGSVERGVAEVHAKAGRTICHARMSDQRGPGCHPAAPRRRKKHG